MKYHTMQYFINCDTIVASITLVYHQALRPYL